MQDKKYLFFGIKNKANHAIVPGTENYFDGIKYEKVMIAKGKFTAILPIPTSINDFLSDHKNHSLKIKEMTEGAREPMILYQKGVDKIQINLATGTKPIEVDSLLFHISFDDAREILESKPTIFEKAEIDLVQQFVNSTSIKGQVLPKGRRTWALVGDSLSPTIQEKEDFFVFLEDSDDKNEVHEGLKNDRSKFDDFMKKYENETGDQQPLFIAETQL